jgi:periodic tryptophan protein 2
MSTGSLVEVLSGHEGPISGICFDPMGHLVGSCSWDKTSKLWDIYSGERMMQSSSHKSDLQSISYSPNRREILVSALDGDLIFYCSQTFSQLRTI